MMDWLKQARGRFINMASSNTAGEQHPAGSNNSNNTSAATTPGAATGATGAANNGLLASSGSGSPISDRPYIHQRYVRQMLPMAHELEAIVTLPSPHIDLDEWLASHIIGLFENTSLVYDALYESCTCPSLTGPGGWVCNHPAFNTAEVDGAVYSARQYIDWVLSQAHELIANHNVFPTRYRVAFQSDFRNHVANISRHLLHTLVHLYGLHFNELVRLDLVGHMNTLSKHFFLFNQHFNLVDRRELEVISDLEAALLLTSPTSQSINSQGCDEGDPLVGTKPDVIEASARR